MNWKAYLSILLCCTGSITLIHAQTAIVKGTITDDYGLPLFQASVFEAGSNNGVLTDTNGQYRIQVNTSEKVFIKVTSIGYENDGFSIKKGSRDTITKDFILPRLTHTIGTVEIRDKSNRTEAGNVSVNIENVNINPSPVSGIEGLLKILVGSNNELTSQYTVRGGNFDENLVYVNDFEIYRPFLVRSGQQEGLSFVNSDLTAGVNFSVGGFQSKYGDKLSSVLDVTYKRPDKFAGSVMLSLLGAQGHIEGITRNKKITYLLGVRQKSNQYLLQSQPTKGQYNPSFTDIQGLVHFKLSSRWEAEVIANYARNRFNFSPEESVAAFGYATEAYKLHTVFNGNEADQFDSRFGGLSLSYKPGEKSRLKLLVSGFQTNEFETYDIEGEYGFYALEADLGKKDFGQEKYSLGTGAIHDFARNYLTANVATVALRGSHDLNKHYIQWGIDGSYVSVNDKMLEWQRRDSAGFSQPYDTTALLMARAVRANNELDYERVSAFLQDNILLGRMMTLNIGVRANYTFLNEELIISPRAQYSIKPDWDRDVVFRISTGLYAQPPFYREMRDGEGILNTHLKAQKSYHAAMGLDYNFTMLGDRPFKLTAEAYYKHLWDLVPYEYDNVRIRYFANNNGMGYAYGGEVRLFGDLVKDAESWVSLGLLKTQNKILNEATGVYTDYIPRPTDQRVSFGMFFSDYLPRNKNFKMYLNMIYATGLPFSPPGKSMVPDGQLRIPAYKRVDIGFSALLIDGNQKKHPAYSFFNAFRSLWISAEVFNLLGIQNTLSYQWIQDFTSERIYAVPNRLTSRLINVKLAAKF